MARKRRRRHHRIVLTGGPGGGKTTAADLFRRELGPKVVVVPEAASLLFNGGFPRTDDVEGRRATQRAIFAVQKGLEQFHHAQYPGRLLLCDRGALDGAAYWPNRPADFYREMGTTQKAELESYDAVLFFESAAVGGLTIEGGNPARTESARQAVLLDSRIRALWSPHPRFLFVPQSTSFIEKISYGLALLQGLVRELG